MSPEESAEFVLKKLHGRIIVSECNTRLIAQAIRQAENEAIERCARKVYKDAPDYLTAHQMKAAIRSLATKDP